MREVGIYSLYYIYSYIYVYLILINTIYYTLLHILTLYYKYARLSYWVSLLIKVHVYMSSILPSHPPAITTVTAAHPTGHEYASLYPPLPYL